MLQNNRHKTYSSVSFDGETVIAKKPTETKDETAASNQAVSAETGETEDQDAEANSAAADDGKDASYRNADGNSIVKAVKSREDMENERKIKKILGLEGRHKLEYSDLLSSFVVLFDNFCRMRDEYARFRKKMAVQERLSAYNGQHGFAPSWN